MREPTGFELVYEAGQMRYIFATPGAQRRVMHIERHTATGDPLWEALCGIDLPFNRTINAPWGLGRPVCKICRRRSDSNQRTRQRSR